MIDWERNNSSEVLPASRGLKGKGLSTMRGTENGEEETRKKSIQQTTVSLDNDDDSEMEDSNRKTRGPKRGVSKEPRKQNKGKGSKKKAEVAAEEEDVDQEDEEDEDNGGSNEQGSEDEDSEESDGE